MKGKERGFGGGHGIQGDLMGTAFILLSSFSSIANPSVHLWSNKPHIIFQSFSRTRTKTGVLHPNLSRLFGLSLSLFVSGLPFQSALTSKAVASAAGCEAEPQALHVRIQGSFCAPATIYGC